MGEKEKKFRLFYVRIQTAVSSTLKFQLRRKLKATLVSCEFHR